MYHGIPWIVQLLGKVILPQLLWCTRGLIVWQTELFVIYCNARCCKLLGIWKLNTTTHHPQCDGMTKWLYCTFKTMLQKQTVKFNWNRLRDTELPGALWAFCNTVLIPHLQLYLLYYLVMPRSTTFLLQKPLSFQELYISLLKSVVFSMKDGIHTYIITY